MARQAQARAIRQDPLPLPDLPMNLPDPKLNPHVEAALQRMRSAADQAAERSAEGMGVAALSATQVRRRDALLSAQFLFRRQLPVFSQQFIHTLREQVAREMAPREPATGTSSKPVELTLMDDATVEDIVTGDRVGLAIGHQCEWELREVDAYIGNLVGAGAAAPERNPLRPEVVGRALLAAVRAVTEEADARQILIDELARALSLEMRGCYADIVDIFRNRGVQAQDLRVRNRNDTGIRAAGDEVTGQGELASGQGSGYGGAHGGAAGRGGGAGDFSGQTIGAVDAQVMSLLRRLSFMPSGAMGLDQSVAWNRSELSSAYDMQAHEGEAGVRSLMAPNLIRAHRDELRQAANAPLDHMVIDVVGSLFDQILSDPKVPPQIARLVARLQLPVLRVALGDVSFFSSRRHPVRRFVNRIASLGAAFDDFEEDPGREFLDQVRELIQEVAEGDFDRMDVYESKLDALEAFIGHQNEAAIRAQGNLPEMLARKEMDLRLQQRYQQQLQAGLSPVTLPEFLRGFLTQVWSQVVIFAARRGDDAPEQIQRFRLLGRDLVMSVQPKGNSSQRQAFLAQLPKLMKTLTEGADLIAWPEPARKQFFAELLPAHADSLKGHSLTALDQNLLVKQLDAVFLAPLPRAEDMVQSSPISLPQDVNVDQHFSSAEASQAGLVDESKVDWLGKVDIDLSADAPLQAVDIKLDGLPAPEPMEPMSGASLMDHLQLGSAYQMHTDGKWLKVRLGHISPGHGFFLFTHGAKHQETLTMTARMLKRMCETDRLRAFENAYLLERATARARKQLAALTAQTRH